MEFNTVEVHGNKIIFSDGREHNYEAVVKYVRDIPSEVDVYILSELDISGKHVSVPKEHYKTFNPEQFNKFLRSLGIWFNVYYKVILKDAEFYRNAIIVPNQPCIRLIQQEGKYKNFQVGDNILSEVLKRIAGKCKVLIKDNNISDNYKSYIESNIGRSIDSIRITSLSELTPNTIIVYIENTDPQMGNVIIYTEELV